MGNAVFAGLVYAVIVAVVAGLWSSAVIGHGTLGAVRIAGLCLIIVVAAAGVAWGLRFAFYGVVVDSDGLTTIGKWSRTVRVPWSEVERFESPPGGRYQASVVLRSGATLRLRLLTAAQLGRVNHDRVDALVTSLNADLAARDGLEQTRSRSAAQPLAPSGPVQPGKVDGPAAPVQRHSSGAARRPGRRSPLRRRPPLPTVRIAAALAIAGYGLIRRARRRRR
jgi:hypothetical protein